MVRCGLETSATRSGHWRQEKWKQVSSDLAGVEGVELLQDGDHWRRPVAGTKAPSRQAIALALSSIRAQGGLGLATQHNGPKTRNCWNLRSLTCVGA